MMRNVTCFLLLAIFLIAIPSAGTGGGDITFTPKNVGKVLFSHDSHTKAHGVKCMACHFSKFAAGSNGFQIKKETLNKREFCGHCHNGLKGFDLESQKNCNRCHIQ